MEKRFWRNDYMKPKIYALSSKGTIQEKKGQENLLKALREGTQDFDILLGTVSMLAVGTDVPSLDTIIFACDIKSSIMCQQATGRILRWFEGKQHPKIVDFDDNYNGILHRQALHRKKFYKTMGWDIIT